VGERRKRDKDIKVIKERKKEGKGRNLTPLNFNGLFILVYT
jgi:hypothetical protein